MKSAWRNLFIALIGILPIFSTGHVARATPANDATQRLRAAIERFRTDDPGCLLQQVIPVWRELGDREKVREILASIAPRLQGASLNCFAGRSEWHSFVNQANWSGCRELAVGRLREELSKLDPAESPGSFRAVFGILWMLYKSGEKDLVADSIDGIPDFFTRENLREEVYSSIKGSHPSLPVPKSPSLEKELLGIREPEKCAVRAREWLYWTLSYESARSPGPRGTFLGISARFAAFISFLRGWRCGGPSAPSILAQSSFVRGCRVPKPGQDAFLRKLFQSARTLPDWESRAKALVGLLADRKESFSPSRTGEEPPGKEMMGYPDLMEALLEVSRNAHQLSEDTSIAFFAYFLFALESSGREADRVRLILSNPSEADRGNHLRNAGISAIRKTGDFEKGEEYRKLAERNASFDPANRVSWVYSAMTEADERGLTAVSKRYEDELSGMALSFEDEGNLPMAMEAWILLESHRIWVKRDFPAPLRLALEFKTVEMRAFCFVRYLLDLKTRGMLVPVEARSLVDGLEASFSSVPTR